MVRLGLKLTGLICALCLAVAVQRTVAYGASLDTQGEIRIGLRAYTGARIGAERTDQLDTTRIRATELRPGGEPFRFEGWTFPISPAGHLRQHRSFLEVQLNHDLRRLLREGFGPLQLLNHLPFRFSELKYTLVFRGEAEGLYDYGPREYRTAAQGSKIIDVLRKPIDSRMIGFDRRRLRRIATHRERLYQAFLDAQIGDLFIRFGRQILVWGETDSFRLLDNINPIDNSFGGFLISLDERRVPLDMLRLNYYLGGIGPFYEAYIEAFAAIDDNVGFIPGVPAWSSWALPNAGATDPETKKVMQRPARTLRNMRGGVQLKFDAPVPAIGDATFGLAYYQTFFDTPAVEIHTTRRSFAIGGRGPGLPSLFPDGDPDGAGFPQDNVPGFATSTGRSVKAFLSAPTVEILGGTATFTVPSRFARAIGLGGEPVVRTELAYFHDEPRFSQSQMDPFMVFAGHCQTAPLDQDPVECRGSRRTGDSWNFVLGIDMNQFIRPLNARQSFFISTQFFFKHLNGALKRGPIDLNGDGVRDPQFLGLSEGEVLPVPEYRVTACDITPSECKPNNGKGFSRDPSFIHNPVDQYLQTLFISTAYGSGQINPSLTLFYDWSGSFAAIPALTLLHDPFRFTLSYSYLNASRLKGASGVSLLRDRDNVLFQIEYVI